MWRQRNKSSRPQLCCFCHFQSLEPLHGLLVNEQLIRTQQAKLKWKFAELFSNCLVMSSRPWADFTTNTHMWTMEIWAELDYRNGPSWLLVRPRNSVINWTWDLCPTKQKTRRVIGISTLLLSIDQHLGERKRLERMPEERLSFWIRKHWQSGRGRGCRH